MKQGQLLADLDTPEIDQELAQAVAQREQTSSSLGLAKSSLERWQQLRQRDAVSQQELDERQSTYNQDVANLAAADANVKRLQQLESFKRIVAPFAGVVTQRNVDVGDLIDAGSGTSRALFALAQSDPLRVYVQLPQAYAQNVSVGQDVIGHAGGAAGPAVSRQDHAHFRRDRRAHALAAGRSDAAESRWQPAARRVCAGRGARGRARAPDGAGQRAAVSRGRPASSRSSMPNGHVRLHKIVIAQDLGQSLEIESGIEASDKIIINPSDSVADGDHVVIAPQQNATAAGVGQQGHIVNSRRFASRCVALLAACTVGPDYRRPRADTPPTWKTDSYWRVGEPSHAPLSPDWWQRIRRPDADHARNAGARAEPDARRRERALRAGARDARADVRARAARNRSRRERVALAHFAATGPLNNYATPNSSTVQNDLQLAPTVNYDVDLFGRIRREVEGARRRRTSRATISRTRGSCSPPISRPTTSRCASSMPKSTC